MSIDVFFKDEKSRGWAEAYLSEVPVVEDSRQIFDLCRKLVVLVLQYEPCYLIPSPDNNNTGNVPLIKTQMFQMLLTT
jgi:hypothetical protein